MNFESLQRILARANKKALSSSKKAIGRGKKL
jgi:hypothetical protein